MVSFTKYQRRERRHRRAEASRDCHRTFPLTGSTVRIPASDGKRLLFGDMTRAREFHFRPPLVSALWKLKLGQYLKVLCVASHSQEKDTSRKNGWRLE
jgi:hypothetical protein